MRQVFISYSSKEASQAKEIVDALEAQGIRCWIAPRDIPVGSDYTDEIPEGIDACPFFLVLLSPNSQASQWVKMELTQAVSRNKYVFPLLLENFTIKKGFKFLLQNAQIRPYYQDHNGILREVFIQITRQFPISSVIDSTSLETQIFSTMIEPAASELSAEEYYRKGEVHYRSRNYEEAIKWYRLAAERGSSAAQCDLGYCYEHGVGIPQDLRAAALWYRKAAENGESMAQYNLGMCYEYNRGVPQDYDMSVMWYRKAADQGNVSAYVSLGNCFQYGNGVPQDLAQAAEWYRKAAEKNHARGQYRLGFFYSKGLGVPQNHKQAAKWYRKSAEQGYDIAQNTLGCCYETGTGIPQDYAQSIVWYRKAADQGNRDSQYNLARMYESGLGVEADWNLAKKWYQKAAEQGDEDAKKKLEKLK